MSYRLGKWQNAVILRMNAMMLTESPARISLALMLSVEDFPKNRREHNQRLRSLWALKDAGFIEEYDGTFPSGRPTRLFRLTEKGTSHADSLHSPTRWTRGPSRPGGDTKPEPSSPAQQSLQVDP